MSRVLVQDGRGSLRLSEVAVAYGKVLPETARPVQVRVGEAFAQMCAAEVDGVDITVGELTR